ncbi:uncharacterized protein L969DRAFT_85322 [Mixia osmundae IAM 14324]|uniref:Geranylgeranyl transferase type-2 subunit alpha n=1 Tax=Mixia osmundae (strain CBS 9802 / IAM 14324 / JCM 22182 / KY 12970) TaxID=764103 RepID=G7DYG8_MIXOS|nr:uncharacterized protein L969DRAFT_85322 [Mixia osmundae IAM 14324]KEI41529.1 hypothetical protein L969DRAFT_85322 [Mixia osmundae IAM 14324]GAA95628.1 hypothetical protein E5Q_02284 [Mixia osmundae IAM 14324]
MENHGVKRSKVKESDAAAQERHKEEAARIVRYKTLLDSLSKAAHDESALDLTTSILEINPDFVTGWNHRRRCWLAMLKSDGDKQARLTQDLQLTMKALAYNPKIYAVWEYRKWLLKVMPDPDWSYELKTVERLLMQDARNFHGWDYRRYIVDNLRERNAPNGTTVKRPAVTDQSEFDFTTRKIASSFSNFSAWHYRSKVLSRLQLDDGLDREFDLVRQAIYTDPEDQSAWIYHRWLIGKGENEALLRREIDAVSDLREIDPDSRWALESLVHNKSLLRKLHSGEEHDSLGEEIGSHLEQLILVDPDRASRYRYLASDI